MLSTLVNSYQTGFVPRGFIGDNGMVLSMVSDQANGSNLPGIGLFLNQEKAYKRVHSGYLSQEMQKFELFSSFVKYIHKIFFGYGIYSI
ncbi:hypothetical protein BDF21DRAFT_352411 [Thamnidium elegans]|nr:hypothetical protein BDF21DRAFT_352411 [Thamnidium elegans]